jgi:hypothetical protein
MEKRIYDNCPCMETGLDGNRSCLGKTTLIESDNAVLPVCANHLPNYLRNAEWKIKSNWKEEIYKALVRVAKREPEWTNDNVFEEFEKTSDIKVHPDKRAYGSVVQKALKNNIMTWTGNSVVSRRSNCHKMLIRVYKSNVYEYTPVSWWKLAWDKVKLFFGWS